MHDVSNVSTEELRARKKKRDEATRVRLDAIHREYEVQENVASRSREGGRPLRIIALVTLGLLALAVISRGGIFGLFCLIAGLCGIAAICVYRLCVSVRGKIALKDAKAQARTAVNNHDASEDIRGGFEDRELASRMRPPIWPPRKPDDWGWDIQAEHQAEVSRVRISNITAPAGWSKPDPIMPPIPSWEAYQSRVQSKDMRQVRWARNEHGEWVKVEWGNAARVVPDMGLPVAQSMRDEKTGEWHWVWIGVGAVSLDWQMGPPREERYGWKKEDGTVRYYRRQVGTVGVTPEPKPIAPSGEHGDSREQGVDDLVRAGIIAPR